MARLGLGLPKKDDMPKPFLTAHVGEELRHSELGNLYSTFIDGQNGFLYGIPAGRIARRVLKFDPKDHSYAAIGPDLGDGAYPFRWRCGVFCDYNRVIYCPPAATISGHNSHFLKINTADDTVEILANVALPPSETSEELSWHSGALANDNRIYYMPNNSRYILKLDPVTETLASVGEDLGDEGGKYGGTVMGLDGCLYGIPDQAERIIKFDPLNPDTLTVVGEPIDSNADDNFDCGNGVLGNDGHIYALSDNHRILKINTTKNNYSWILDSPSFSGGWGNPIMGIDDCIYWPPIGTDCLIKFDPGSQKLTIAGSGDDIQNDYNSYLGGALAKGDIDGVIYCIPYDSKRILAIDPFNELSMTLEKHLYEFPNEMGRLFATMKDEDGDCAKDEETFYENAARKFGTSTILELLDKILPYDSSSNDSSLVATKYDKKNDSSISATILKVQNKMRKDNDKHHPLFTIAASCENSHLDVVYHLLRRDVSSLCGYIGTAPGDDGQGPNNATIDGRKDKGCLKDCEQEKKRKFLDESG